MLKYIYVVIGTFMGLCSHAQIGTTRIGERTLVIDSLGISAVGNARTPKCLFPGASCGGGCPIYRFIGTGNWSIAGNWDGNTVPPARLPNCYQIIIDPVGSTECLLDIPGQHILPGANIIVKSGKLFRVPGKLINGL